MSTPAAEAPRGLLDRPPREMLGWIAMALACAGVAFVITRDAGRGSLNVGWIQAAAAFGLFAGAIWAKGFATGRPAAAVQDIARTGAISLQLFLLAVAIGALQVENPAFYRIVIPLAFSGFLIHHALPAALRPPFFVGLSFATIAFVFGPVDGAWLVALGLVLIGLCHLPIRWLARVLLILVVGGVYAFLRSGRTETPWTAAIWPILGSMFMFRLIVYLHYLKHAKERPNGWKTLSYFFLLPNVMFPLFPVIDFKTFERTYYDRDEHGIYQRGVRWMLLGLAHLIAYRMVYHHVILPQGEVQTAADLGRQMAGNFMLYLRVSGQFHFIVGLLHLFGFGLPETNRFFFLTSGFTDFWRRINIYWKDFMMKTFYYPSVFILKKRGMTLAVVVGTVFVFFLNWVLHAYQWYWVVGITPVSATDTLFWTVIGTAVVVSGVWELKKGRQRSLSDERRLTFGAAFVKALKIVAFFCTISFLWSMWTTPSFEQWFVLLDVSVSGSDLLALGSALGVALLGLTLFYTRGSGLVEGSAKQVGAFSFRHAGLGTASAALLLVLASPATFSGASPEVQRFAQSLRVEELNRADSETLTRGYYERLTGVNQFNAQLWSAYSSKTDEEDIWDPFTAGMVPMVDDYRRRVMVPLFGELTSAGWVTSNSDGLHDREYDRERRPGTFRVALMGPSFVAAVKVGTGNAFESLAETRLAAERARGEGPGREVEILNFGVPGYTMAQQLYLLGDKVLGYRPDVVVLAANQQDVTQNFSYLSWIARRSQRVPPPYGDYLHGVLARAAIDSTTSDAAARAGLDPFGWEIMEWAYRELAAAIEAGGAEAVWVHTPMAAPVDDEVVARMRAIAEEAGFRTYDLREAIEGHEYLDLAISPMDRHLNVLGNQLMAVEFADVVRELELAGGDR